jgi:phospholipase/carboxylesterase
VRLASLVIALLAGCASGSQPSGIEAIERTVGEGDGPIVILLHGFGSVPETFLGLAQRGDLPPGTRLVFPRAPEHVPHHTDGLMWWPLPRDLERIPRERLPGMDDARARIRVLVDRLGNEMPGRPIVLGGFSQGAMVSLDVALHDPISLAGLVLMSGTMIDERDTLAHLEARRGLRVYMSHGTHDPVLRYADDVRLRDAMQLHGLDVSFTSFEGVHEVTERVSMEVAAFIRRCAESR